MRNRYAAFFLKANPEHFRGVELACVAEFDIANLKRYGADQFRRRLCGMVIDAWSRIADLYRGGQFRIPRPA